MRLLWLADVLRAAGLTVHEYPGWQTRGSDSWGPLVGLICHATAGTGSDAQETRTLWVTGSTSAPAPIAQLYVNRAGEWWVGASGRCNHVKRADVRPTSPLGPAGNTELIGVEAANDNRGEPWPAVQLRSYARGVAAICRHLRWPPNRVAAHWEHQSGKSDPAGIDMHDLRADVAYVLAGGILDMEQSERLVQDTGSPNRTVGNVLADVENLRNWIVSPPGAGIGTPPPGSVGAIMLESALRGPLPPTPMDVEALAAALRPYLEAAAEAAVRKVLGEVDE